jgi:hypothetical protein
MLCLSPYHSFCASLHSNVCATEHYFPGILQGVYKRALQGNASDPRAQSVGAAAKEFAAAAIALIEGVPSLSTPAPKRPVGPAQQILPARNLLEMSDICREYHYRVAAFIERHVVPNIATYDKQYAAFGNDRWQVRSRLFSLFCLSVLSNGYQLLKISSKSTDRYPPLLKI